MRAEGDPERGGPGGVPGCTWDEGRRPRGDPGASPGPENGRRVGAQRGAGLPAGRGVRVGPRRPRGHLGAPLTGVDGGVSSGGRESRGHGGAWGGSARSTARPPSCRPRGHAQVPLLSGPSGSGTAPSAVTVLWEGAQRPGPTSRSATAAAQQRERGIVSGVGRCSHAPPATPSAPVPPRRAPPSPRNPTRLPGTPQPHAHPGVAPSCGAGERRGAAGGAMRGPPPPPGEGSGEKRPGERNRPEGCGGGGGGTRGGAGRAAWRRGGSPGAATPRVSDIINPDEAAGPRRREVN